jgi:sporulation protein YlmC with PRC-barrel domain
MQVSFGRSVKCRDGSFGKLADVVVDPATMRLTHLITSPPDAEPRLIPLELADTAAGGPDLALSCTLAATEELASVREYRDLQSAEETDADDDWDLGVEHVLALPYDTAGGLGLGAYEGVEPSLNVSYDRVPKGSAELRQASAILTADGHYLGGIKGFQLADGGRITEVVLEESHFWSRNEITIPIDAVQTLETDTVVVRLSADEIAELPTTRVRRWF